jgi:hypothetical protein
MTTSPVVTRKPQGAYPRYLLSSLSLEASNAQVQLCGFIASQGSISREQVIKLHYTLEEVLLVRKMLALDSTVQLPTTKAGSKSEEEVLEFCINMIEACSRLIQAATQAVLSPDQPEMLMRRICDITTEVHIMARQCGFFSLPYHAEHRKVVLRFQAGAYAAGLTPRGSLTPPGMSLPLQGRASRERWALDYSRYPLLSEEENDVGQPPVRIDP